MSSSRGDAQQGGDVALFVGPSVSAAEIQLAWKLPGVDQSELTLELLPPVSQGDVASLVQRGPRAIGIIDGYFDRVPAVWHKEILWAMSRGVHVFGAASMGALRAAELARFGMRGVGAIFEAFESDALQDDDEVTVAHAGPEDSYRALSVALVDIRATLRRAVDEGVVESPLGDALIEHARSLFYPRRDFEALLSWGTEQGWGQPVETLKAWLPEGRVRQKRLDALAMVRQMAEFLSTGPEAMEVRYPFHATTSWRDLQRSLVEQRPLDGRAGAETLPEGALLDELRLLGAPYRRLRGEALTRLLALEAAEVHGLQIGRSTTARRQALLDWRRRMGLTDDAAWQDWRQAQGTSASQMERILGDERRAQKMMAYAQDPLEGQLLDDLRRLGHLAFLRERARRKEEVLAQQGLSRVELKDQGPDDAALWNWYFTSRLDTELPTDLTVYAHEHDFKDVNELRWTVLREYLLQTLCDDEIVGCPSELSR